VIEVGQECTKAQYRKFYKKYYNIDFSNEYVIHHIDGNRENNHIDNLLLLPRGLHKKYHYLKSLVDNIDKYPTQIVGNMVGPENYNREIIANFEETLKECNKWHDYKVFLEHNNRKGM
jgi:hypothetical protein